LEHHLLNEVYLGGLEFLFIATLKEVTIVVHPQVLTYFVSVAEDITKEDPEAAKELTEGFSAQYHCIFGSSKNEYKHMPGKPIMPEASTSDYTGVDHCGLVSAGMPGQLFCKFYPTLCCHHAAKRFTKAN
jgi:hypothetical protein